MNGSSIPSGRSLCGYSRYTVSCGVARSGAGCPALANTSVWVRRFNRPNNAVAYSAGSNARRKRCASASVWAGSSPRQAASRIARRVAIIAPYFSSPWPHTSPIESAITSSETAKASHQSPPMEAGSGACAIGTGSIIVLPRVIPGDPGGLARASSVLCTLACVCLGLVIKPTLFMVRWEHRLLTVVTCLGENPEESAGPYSSSEFDVIEAKRDSQRLGSGVRGARTRARGAREPRAAAASL